MSPGSAARRRAIRKLIAERDVASQRELVNMLAAAGHPVTQATVSRDLDAIGAVKVRLAGTARYVIPRPRPDDEEMKSLARAIADFVDEISPAGNIVVLKTPPGAAQIVAGAIDQARLESVVGTVAGDDTIMAVAADEAGGTGLAEELERIGADA